MHAFTDLGVPDDLVDALDAHDIDRPFPIQAETIPPAMEGHDVSGRAPTGSGKTFAFGIPVVARVQRARPKRPRALILVPTRELAAQVTRDLSWLGAGRDVRVQAFYGGTKFEPQVKALRRGVDIAVACPGRLVDLINQGLVRLDGVDLVVVDEADRMADMGFLPEVKRLIDQTDPNRQTLLFSATLDGDIEELVRRYQNDPITVDVTPETESTRLDHHFWTVPHADRVATTAAVIQRVGPTVVFTRTRHGADRVTRQLERSGVQAVAIHGNRTQNQRERALQAFRTGHAQALVATDVAARGIHVDDVACVVHFDLPEDPKDYIHRSGRTGRAGATGIVVALAMPDRRKDTKKLLKALDLGITATEADVEALPEGEHRHPAPLPRSKPRGAAGSTGGDFKHKKNKKPHKPSGKQHKPGPQSPTQTKPGRSKGYGTRDDRGAAGDDPRRAHDAGSVFEGTRPGNHRKGGKALHSDRRDDRNRDRGGRKRTWNDDRNRPDRDGRRGASERRDDRQSTDDGSRSTRASSPRPSSPSNPRTRGPKPARRGSSPGKSTGQRSKPGAPGQGRSGPPKGRSKPTGTKPSRARRGPT